MDIQNFIMKTPGPKISKADLLKVEQRLGNTLPDDYKEFLLKFNGGTSEYYKSTDAKIRVDNWLSIVEAPIIPLRSIPAINASMRKSDVGWREFVIFATDIADNYLALKCVGEKSEGVFYCDWHDVQYELEKIELLYSSFTEFLLHLESAPLFS